MVAVTAVVLGDLYLWRYRVVGPWVFGIAAGVVGAIAGWRVGRAQAAAAPPDSGGDGSPAVGAVQDLPPLARVLMVVGGAAFALLGGISSLAEPENLRPPEFETINWSSPRDTNRPHIWWERVRVNQTTTAPIFLFIGGAVCGVAVGYRPHLCGTAPAQCGGTDPDVGSIRIGRAAPRDSAS